jgi:O-acetyl-ADP-ribose deacetylase (regulator of RNase III)
MTKIRVIKGDITELRIDAIVNAANNHLRGGGGVDGAIHYAAGPELLKECVEIGFCDTGEAKITKGYNLPAKFVIHTVGPIYGHTNGRDAELLRNCYYNSLDLAVKNNIKSIAFPGISTGVFRYPKEEACKIAATTIKEFIGNNKESFDEIIFVTYDDESYGIYLKLLMI